MGYKSDALRALASLSRKPSRGPSDRSRLNRPDRPRYRVGRNQPCPCGSGKKFKHCCIHVTAGAILEAVERAEQPDSGDQADAT